MPSSPNDGMSISSNTGKQQEELMNSTIQFVFHMFFGDRTIEIVREIDEWIRQGREEDLTNMYSRNLSLHRIDLMGMMSEILISSKGPKEGTALFLQYAERNAAYFNRFSKDLGI